MLSPFSKHETISVAASRLNDHVAIIDPDITLFVRNQDLFVQSIYILRIT